jgi:non-heme chloroperoxidase
VVWVLLGLVGAVTLTLGAALFLVTRPMPQRVEPTDVFGFAGTSGERDAPPALAAASGLARYRARDGSWLSHRFYDSPADAVLIFLHGSSYHGGGYHDLAQAIAAGGHAKVYLPNLRGHYMSGARRGDVDYIGQLEDDLADLIAFAREQGHRGPVLLGGHSSGGGLAIRFAGGAHRDLVDAFVLLSPVLPVAPTTRGGDAGGWASLAGRRLAGLLILNAFGVTGFNALPSIQFNKPEEYWDGTETLSYSYRLNASYHPRYAYQADVAALGDRVLLLVGEDDEANDASAYAALFAESPSQARIEILPGVDHFGVFTEAAALERLAAGVSRLAKGGLPEGQGGP